MKSRAVCFRLNKLAKEENIVDDNGCLWHFHFHQFRHTIATRMINNGVPQHIVQRFLGHVSPEMTKRYAALHDSTLKKEFIKFQKRTLLSEEERMVKESLPDPSALGDYQQQLVTIKKCIKMAEMKGWGKSFVKNIQVKEKLEKIIAIIKGENSDVVKSET